MLLMYTLICYRDFCLQYRRLLANHQNTDNASYHLVPDIKILSFRKQCSALMFPRDKCYFKISNFPITGSRFATYR